VVSSLQIFRLKFYMYIPHPSLVIRVLQSLTLLYFITLVLLFGEANKIWRTSLCNFLNFPLMSKYSSHDVLT
jgi:hypothetical protein